MPKEEQLVIATSEEIKVLSILESKELYHFNLQCRILLFLLLSVAVVSCHLVAFSEDGEKIAVCDEKTIKLFSLLQREALFEIGITGNHISIPL